MPNIERRRDQAINVQPVVRAVPTVHTVEENDRLTWIDKRLDRVQESRHIVTIREHERGAIEGAAEQAAAGFVDVAAIEARRRINTAAKEEMLRARRETLIMAGEDDELRMKMSLLDDDLFQYARLRGLR
ncbi:hypothetical protein E9529_04550 [Blastococcus sp. KM273128]|uniref:hypothetical protein n=1 Tax=Blastococcus sp. KM273128 TaxID=2570314 RepID=UPI001F186CE5|nr:hypothetical protein [Blastococcus sp. KM273128]MCF6743553.1 hypothetical protein [Blastococcus sp. KM273128]